MRTCTFWILPILAAGAAPGDAPLPPERPAEWLEGLTASDPHVRGECLAALREQPERAEPDLLALLRGMEGPDRELARTAEALRACLDDRDWMVREEATLRLLRIGYLATEGLRATAAEGSPEARSRARRVLEEIGRRDRGIDPLRVRRRHLALDLLLDLPPRPEHLPVLMELLREGNARAGRGLRERATPDDLPAVRRFAARAERPLPLYWGLATLATHADPDALSLFRRHADHERAEIRCIALLGLGRTGGEEDLRILIHASETSDPATASAALAGLAAMPHDLTEKPVRTLLAAQLDRDRARAAASILVAGGTPPSRIPETWIRRDWLDRVLAGSAPPEDGLVPLPGRYDVRLGDGTSFASLHVVSLDPSGHLVLEDAGGTRRAIHSIETTRIVRSGRTRAAVPDGRLRLGDGTWLAGRPGPVEAGGLVWESDVLASIRIPLPSIRTWRRETSPQVVGTNEGHDWTVRSLQGVRLEGSSVEETADGLTVATKSGESARALPWDRVAEIHGPGRAPAGGPAPIWIALSDGSRLAAWPLWTGPDGMRVASPTLGSLRIPDDALDAIEREPTLPVPAGRVVVDHATGTLHRFGPDGEPAGTIDGLSNPHDIEILPDGNYLIAERGRREVIVLSPSGERLAAYPAPDPVAASRTPEGNVLVTDLSSGRVMEIDPDGESVWQVAWLRMPIEADRLPNGNTLICEGGRERVVEIAPDGRIVWEYAGVAYPADADRLPNGNTLIADREGGWVREITPEGTVAWEARDLPTPYDADRLPGGNTLVVLGTGREMVEIAPDGAVVRRITIPGGALEVEAE